MLISFRCSNYKSFDKDGVLVMTKGGSRSHPNHVADVGQGTLKHAVIYGSNASGKSTLISAMEVSQKIIQGNHISREFDIEVCSEYYCKMCPENENKPTVFEYVFTYNGHTFDYGFASVLSELNSTEEWLCLLSEDMQSYECIYHTEYVDGRLQWSADTQLTEGDFKIIENLTPFLHDFKSYIGDRFDFPLIIRYVYSGLRQKDYISSVKNLPRNIKLIYDAAQWFSNNLIVNSKLNTTPSALERGRGPAGLKQVAESLNSIGIEVLSVDCDHRELLPNEIELIKWVTEDDFKDNSPRGIDYVEDEESKACLSNAFPIPNAIL